MYSYKSFVTILQSYIKSDRAVSEELRSQDFLIVHYSEKCYSSITPTKYVESKWRYSMLISISCVTILQSFIKIGQAFFTGVAFTKLFGRKNGRTNADHYYVTPSLCGGGQKGYTGWIYTFIQTRNNRVQTYGWPTLGQTDLRTNGSSD